MAELLDYLLLQSNYYIVETSVNRPPLVSSGDHFQRWWSEYSIANFLTSGKQTLAHISMSLQMQTE